MRTVDSSEIRYDARNGISVSVRKIGTGNPLVLLHSSTASHQQWKSAFETFADEFHIVAPDLIGYGDTDDWPVNRPPLTLDDEADAVEAVISKCGGAVHVVGHSYGGATALHLARRDSRRIASLCLIEPTAFHILSDPTPEHAPLFDEAVQLARDVGDGVADGFPMAAAKRFISYWCGEAAWNGFTSEKKWAISRRMRKVNQDFHAITTEPTVLADYGRLNVPTLLISGTMSPKPVRYIARLLAETIPGARHRTVPWAGHMLPITHPLHVNTLIAAHLYRAIDTDSCRAA